MGAGRHRSAGASFAAVTQLASRENITLVLNLSIFCFAIAIPASVAMVFISQLAFPEGKILREASQMALLAVKQVEKMLIAPSI